MTIITNLFCRVFNPQKPKETNYQTLVQAVKDQRYALITKIALFTIASTLTTATLVLSEAEILVWPISLAVFGITLFFSSLFLRLNHIDRRHTQFVDDDTRSKLVKNEMEALFHEECCFSDKEFIARLKGINKVLGNVIFDKEKIKRLTTLRNDAFNAIKSLSVLALETNKTDLLNFSCFSKWTEAGQFGLPAYEYEVNISFSLSPGQTVVSYHCTKLEK